ncbi:unnamed protein product [Merluccius merluccius]
MGGTCEGSEKSTLRGSTQVPVRFTRDVDVEVEQESKGLRGRLSSGLSLLLLLRVATATADHTHSHSLVIGSAPEEDFFHQEVENIHQEVENLHIRDNAAEEQQAAAGLVKIREASDIELKLNEVERLLKNAINLPWKFSRSEVMLTFFERSPLDQVLRNDKVHRIQPCFQSPLNISEIMRSNGFCLANTETIVFDERLSPADKERPSSTDSEDHAYDDGGGGFLPPEPEPCDEEPEAYVTNLSYYHLVPFETDILE